jgi:uncharacterized small protein (DUF1192 family)
MSKCGRSRCEQCKRAVCGLINMGDKMLCANCINKAREEAHAEIAQLRETVRTLIDANDAQADQIAKLQQENERLKSICPTRWWCCTADYPNHDENCPNNTGALKVRVQVLEQAISALKAEIARLESAKLDAVAARVTAQNDGAILRGQIAKLQQENERLKTHVDTCPLAIKGYHDVARFYEDNEALNPRHEKESK